MDAIKKKMQSMKLEKEAALDKADQLEQKLAEQKEVNEKVSFMAWYCLRERFFAVSPLRMAISTAGRSTNFVTVMCSL